MRVVKSVKSLKALAQLWARKGKSVGFVPTMGALHEGHLSLVRAAKKKNNIVIVSIFVNPKQFSGRKDFSRYPRTQARDIKLLKSVGADVVFTPKSNELYPKGFSVKIDPGSMEFKLEGKFRPGHFRGVLTIVSILFNICRPTNSYFGQKDYQQTVLIKQMVKDLAINTKIHVLPTIRDSNNLACSSRNAYLSRSQFDAALFVSKALFAARDTIRIGERSAVKVKSKMRRILNSSSLISIDYATCAEAGTCKELTGRLKGKVVLLIAVRIGAIRLIDNLLVDV